MMDYSESEKAVAESIAASPHYSKEGLGFRELEHFKDELTMNGVEVSLDVVTDGVRKAFNDIMASRWPQSSKPANGEELISRGFFIRNSTVNIDGVVYKLHRGN